MTELERLLDAWPMLRGKGPDVWAAFARVLLDKGKGVEAFTLALATYEHPDCCNRDRQIASSVLSAGVPKWHWNLVRDKVRNAAYEAALARSVGPDSLVLDIGAGTGLLGLMALRAGAGQVVACEMNPATAWMAMDIARANGMADRLRIIAKKSTDLVLGEDLERPADVIVSEIVDNALLGEGVLPTHREPCPVCCGLAVRSFPERGRSWSLWAMTPRWNSGACACMKASTFPPSTGWLHPRTSLLWERPVSACCRGRRHCSTLPLISLIIGRHSTRTFLWWSRRRGQPTASCNGSAWIWTARGRQMRSMR